MKQKLTWMAAGALSLIGIAGISCLVFFKLFATGFSARSAPSLLEAVAAQQARNMAMPITARDRKNPVAGSREVVEEGMAHWADHCAVCHGNNGSGELSMGQQMYPHSPDMRKSGTQGLLDGELFYIIENGIRLSGMPAFGGPGGDENESWKLVYFIRHLPEVTPAELAQMEKLNPKGPEDQERDQEAEDFLNGQSPSATPKAHRH